jgi:hypothetical protein
LSAIDIWFSPPRFVNTCLEVFTAPIGEILLGLRDLVASGKGSLCRLFGSSGAEGPGSAGQRAFPALGGDHYRACEQENLLSYSGAPVAFPDKIQPTTARLSAAAQTLSARAGRMKRRQIRLRRNSLGLRPVTRRNAVAKLLEAV